MNGFDRSIPSTPNFHSGWKSEEAIDYYLRIRRLLLRDKYLNHEKNAKRGADAAEVANSVVFDEELRKHRSIVFQRMYPRTSAAWTHSIVTSTVDYSDESSEVFSMSDSASRGNNLDAASLQKSKSSPKLDTVTPSEAEAGSILAFLPPLSLRRKGTIDKSISKYYEFVGMYHIFDFADYGAISCMKFANNTREKLAVGTSSGHCIIASVYVQDSPADSPSVAFTLKIDDGELLDLHWGSTNEYIYCVTSENHVSIIDANGGKVLRTSDVEVDPLCFCMHPFNNNSLFVSSGGKRRIFCYNVSTGMEITHSKILDSPVTAICTNESGSVLFGGTSRGIVYTFTLADSPRATKRKLTRTRESVSIALRKREMIGETTGFSILSIVYRNWITSARRTPMLLCSCSDDRVRVLSFDEDTFSISTVGIFSGIKIGREKINCIFCPLISNRNGACIVMGSEDMTVNILDLYDAKSPMRRGKFPSATEPVHPVNKLYGHSSAVNRVDFSFDESLLASGDGVGIVIVWSREKIRRE